MGLSPRGPQPPEGAVLLVGHHVEGAVGPLLDVPDAALAVGEEMLLAGDPVALDVEPDEAAYEMGLLGHDFYLFTDSRSGKDAVVYRDGNGRFAIRGEAVVEGESAPLVEMVGTAPTLSDNEARTRLEVGGEPFVFYLDPETGRGRVLYIRYDGHYGLITAAAE